MGNEKQFVYPLFNSEIEEVSPIMLAAALGFDVELDSPDGDELLEQWTPKTPSGFFIAGKYDSEDGPIAFFVKPRTYLANSLMSMHILMDYNAYENLMKKDNQ